MNIKRNLISVLTLILLFFTFSFTTKAEEETTIMKSDGSGELTYLGTSVKVTIPKEYIQPETEFRAAWVSALVGDISTFSTEAQYKKEILGVLDVLEHYNMNAMIFHIRIKNDAFYNSKYNNYSVYYNTNPSWEALPWIIEECHKRGIEFHAWLNPYRVGTSKTRDVSSITKNFPTSNPAFNANNLLVSNSPDEYGNYSIILNPGLPNVRTFLINTCMEVVQNYDVDAIHFDDYFYISDVDDSDTRAKYNTKNLSLDNFRREQVDMFIESLSKAMREYNKENNKRVQLGISPSGIWRSGSGKVTYNADGDAITDGSSTTSTFQHYGNYLYADTVKWINEEWIDYILPQTYWAMEHGLCAYADLISWWDKVVKYKNVKLYSGMGLYLRTSTGGSSWYTSDYEAYNQLMFCQKLENVSGFSYFAFNNLESTLTNKKSFKGVDKLLTTKVPLPEITTQGKLNVEKPTNLRVGTDEYGNVVEFDKDSNAKFYIIYRSENEITFSPEEVYDIIGSEITNGNVIDYVDDSTTDTKYYYGVKAQSYSLTLSEGVSSKVNSNNSFDKISLGGIEGIVVGDNKFPDENVEIKWDELIYSQGDECKYKFEYSYDNVSWNEEEVTIGKQGVISSFVKVTKESGKIYYKITAYNNIGISQTETLSFDILAVLGSVNNFKVVGDFYTSNKVTFIWNNIQKYSGIQYELQMSTDKENWQTLSTKNNSTDVNNTLQYSLPKMNGEYYYRIMAKYNSMIGYSNIETVNVHLYLGEFTNIKINGESVENPYYAYNEEYVDVSFKAFSYGGKTIVYTGSVSTNYKDFNILKSYNSKSEIIVNGDTVTARIYFNDTSSKIYFKVEARIDEAYTESEVFEIYLQPLFFITDEILKYMVDEKTALINKTGLFN